MSLKGILAGPISGLRYQTPRHAGVTSDRGEFTYEPGERIAFLVGGQALGSAVGAPRLTLADLISRVDGNPGKLMDPGLTNVARFLCTLDRDDNLDTGVQIPPQVHDIIGRRRIDFRHDVDFAGVQADPVAAFAADPVVVGILADLDRAGVFAGAKPRTVCSPAAARNQVRRNILGIRRCRDVRIPLRNGLHVLADVFRPDKDGRFPVVMNCGPYGRAFNHHSICSEADFLAHEEMEERYFLGNRDGLVFENHETVNTAVWVPADYVVMRVDGPGSGRNPGKLAPWGIETAEAFRDAIEWAAEQPWSNGHVGLWGMSYYAMSQHAAASLNPRGLKAMIAIGTDLDMYEEVAYTGGILNEEFFLHWYRAGVLPPVCGTPNEVGFMDLVRSAPFKDSDPAAAFGPRSTVFMNADLRDVQVPLWVVACTTHLAHFHQLGSSEAYLATPTPHKKIDFWEDWFTKPYSRLAVADHMAFFDHWLKGVDNGVMARPPVRLEIRAGNGCSYLQEEQEWPVARTRYTRWHFDAVPADWAGDEHRSDFLRLSTTAPASRAQATYSAEIPLECRSGPPAALIASKPPSALLAWKTGVSFISEPVAEDMVLAGYGKAGLWVSSTSADMDIFLGVRIIDEQGHEVDYAGTTTMGLRATNFPLMKGWLKVSHRRIDAARSTEYTVKHTHRKADYAPLSPGEPVKIEIEIIPTTALIRRGHRIRVDIQPFDGFDHGTRHAYDPSYHDGARNTIWTGPEHPGYVQLPVVPPR
ncbi:MAG: CocE/NonD family hydrolase [Steroidobacteraceae bacterium]|nr:CocE/NonD family hydrolase [Nevskiaceae bacterium]MCP5472501.1 CocE/NonD family hydrolase [Nevskiaceae bacterium]